MPRKARYPPGGLVYHVLTRAVAGLVERAEEWRWSSLWARRDGPPQLTGLLSAWPGGRPKRRLETVNRPMSRKDLESQRTCIRRGRPCGDDRRQKAMVAKLDLMHTICSAGRPKKETRGKHQLRPRKGYVPVATPEVSRGNARTVAPIRPATPISREPAQHIPASLVLPENVGLDRVALPDSPVFVIR